MIWNRWRRCLELMVGFFMAAMGTAGLIFVIGRFAQLEQPPDANYGGASLVCVLIANGLIHYGVKVLGGRDED
jgi:hypothetical protein